ncbi:MAG: hypothetical protein KC912_18370 [Proteobacteria bacterium]|nr:hypothetical protein [Pseudomonadota bacterium]
MFLFLAQLALAAPVPAGIQHAEIEGTPIRFVHSRLTEIDKPTSLDFGPDGRLYVAQLDGAVQALSIERLGPGRYTVSAVETIPTLQAIPNRDDDGTARPDLKTRLVTGILVEGTADQPVIYATSSDPRLGDKGGTPLGIDPESGVLSRLTKSDQGWTREDLVTGLPRSAEDHGPHGIARLGDRLLIAQGGSTNQGAPSKSFSMQRETALSAAILSVDLTALDAGASVYAPGFRNPYDLVVSEAGQVYATDNGPNRTWGGSPTDCSHRPDEGGETAPDTLHRIEPGTYGGHANPVRGQTDPRQCIYQAAKPSSIAQFGSSTNGLTEYTSESMGGALKGHLLTVSFSGELWDVHPDGTSRVLTRAIGAWPLDVTAQADDEPFPGTIWVAVYLQNRIQVLEPIAKD